MMNLAKARKMAFDERVEEGAKMILRHREEWDQFSVLLEKAIEAWRIDYRENARPLGKLKKTAVALASKQNLERRACGLD